ncbi:MAG: hypothetical protein JNM62_08655 [Flavobacteriales bacterium]|nr:hypothetical protein [Flavobacteriales bacterium]
MHTHHAYPHDHLARFRRSTDTTGEPFHPTPFVPLLRAQCPAHPALAFARCTAAWHTDALYIPFIASPHRAARWQFAGAVLLHHTPLGTLVVDALHGPEGPGGSAIGGSELLGRVMAPHASDR